MDISVEMTAELVLWVSIAMGRPIPSAPLHVEPVSPHQMREVACDKQEAQAANVIVLCPFLGKYDFSTHTIYIANWLDEPRTRSYLAHEIVHWYQDAYGVDFPFPCAVRIVLELEAYSLQNLYIKDVLKQNYFVTPQNPICRVGS